MPFTHAMTLGGRFMGLFVGSNGSGKTIAAASWPGPTLILDFDGRVAPVRFFYPNRQDIEYWTVGLEGSTRKDVIGFKEFVKKFEDFQDRCPYETIIFDSYTAFSSTAIWHQMGIRETDVKRTKGGLPIPDWDEFKGETGVMLQVLEIAKVLPCNFICTAHPVTRARTTKQGGSANDVLASMIKVATLATYGWKTESFLPNYFNEIYFFHTDVSSQVGNVNKHYVQTVSAGEVMGKTALPLPVSIEITGKPLFPILQEILKQHNIALQERMEAAAKAKEEADKKIA